ncbi:receptor-type tyrosine-protein phosphatase H-like [Mixophyes fleayi]|uniref:receptor-type tyrosine-protein phosphatase H-like n=1 Tax=Mixophyes fleayi TaxID=3061075 RepID=UPI003F4DAF5D
MCSPSWVSIPEIVKNFAAENITTTSVSLSWQPPVGNASSYIIEILENSTFSVTVSATSATLDQLTPGNYYTFMVSTLVGGTVKGKSFAVANYTKPGVVKKLTTLNITTTSISLSWQKPDGNASSYLIQIMGNPNRNQTVTTNNTTMEDLSPGNYYTFLVSALVDKPNTQGNTSATSARTNANSVFVSFTYSSRDENRKINIIKEINSLLQSRFPNQNVTAVWKRERPLSN